MMNDEQWYEHRAEMSNYMPTMIAFKRKRSGWKRTVENILVGLLIILVVSAEVLFVWTAARLGAGAAWGMTFACLYIDYWLAEMIFRFVYADDSGLHNLPGYDPKTGTVKGLERYDTSKFWYKEPPSKRRR